MSPKGLPDRWMDYSPMGEVITGTRFICMKVPLKPSLLHSVSKDNKFSCEHAMDMVTTKGRKLGLVIDLTFTQRYYDPSIFERENILYKKIFMPGRVIPDKRIIREFFSVIEDFEQNNRDNDDVIAVHCTHGLNRTGYMVCKYMVEIKGLTPEDAIKSFEKARGYKIERELYLDDLRGDSSPPSKESKQNMDTQHQSHSHRYEDRYGPVAPRQYYRAEEERYWHGEHNHGRHWNVRRYKEYLYQSQSPYYRQTYHHHSVSYGHWDHRGIGGYSSYPETYDGRWCARSRNYGYGSSSRAYGSSNARHKQF